MNLACIPVMSYIAARPCTKWRKAILLNIFFVAEPVQTSILYPPYISASSGLPLAGALISTFWFVYKIQRSEKVTIRLETDLKRCEDERAANKFLAQLLTKPTVIKYPLQIKSHEDLLTPAERSNPALTSCYLQPEIGGEDPITGEGYGFGHGDVEGRWNLIYKPPSSRHKTALIALTLETEEVLSQFQRVLANNSRTPITHINQVHPSLAKIDFQKITTGLLHLINNTLKAKYNLQTPLSTIKDAIVQQKKECESLRAQISTTKQTRVRRVLVIKLLKHMLLGAAIPYALVLLWSLK